MSRVFLFWNRVGRERQAFLARNANCVIASKKMSKRGTRDALDQLSLNLMDEASAVEKEQKIPPAPIDLH